MSSGVLFFVSLPVGVSGIELVLETVNCFNDPLEFSGLVGCGVLQVCVGF